MLVPPIHWTVQLAGPSDVLELLPRILPGPPHRAFRHADVCYLESEAFAELTDHLDVGNRANVIVRRSVALLQLYSNFSGEVFADGVVGIDARGTRSATGSGVYGTFRVVSSEGVDRLASKKPPSTLACRLLAHAEGDDLTAEILGVVGTSDIGWRDLYILLELMGGVREIARRGWATESDLRNIRETANTYRHGSVCLARVHRTVPLREARHVVKQLIVRWLEERATSSSHRAGLAGP